MNSPCPQHGHPHRLIQQPLNELTDQLRKKSRKITGPRQAILDVLRKHASPLTNKEIHAALGKGDCDLATVYRTMHALEDMGLVNRYDFGDGIARFELTGDTSDEHHHHLVCTGCSMVIEVEDCCLSDLQELLTKRHGFHQITHRLEFFGLCPRCHSAATATSDTFTPDPETGSSPTASGPKAPKEDPHNQKVTQRKPQRTSGLSQSVKPDFDTRRDA